MEEKFEFKMYKNIDFRPKIFGIFERNSFILSMIILFILIKILIFLKIAVLIRIQIISTIAIPLLIISANSNKHENPIYIFEYLLKFYLEQNLYLYERECLDI